MHDSEVSLQKQHANFWISLEWRTGSQPVTVQDIFCCGYRYARVTTHVVLFNLPDPPCYLSAECLNLDVDSCDEKEPRSTGIDRVLHQVNAGSKVAEYLQRIDSGEEPHPGFVKRKAAGEGSTIDVPLLVRALLHIYSLLALVTRCANYRMPLWMGGCSLCSISSTISHFDRRLREVLWVPFRLWKLQSLAKSSNRKRALRVALFNAVWLLVNDVAFGLIGVLYLWDMETVFITGMEGVARVLTGTAV